MILALILIVVAGVLMVLSVNKRQWPVSIGGKLIYARIADTDSLRQKGLSGTSGLGESEGMLFIFDTPGRWGMWMKDMKFSIDIVWMDSNKKIVHIEQNVSPDTYPRSFLPDEDALYVLELPAGFAERNHVGLGQVVGFTVH